MVALVKPDNLIDFPQPQVKRLALLPSRNNEWYTLPKYVEAVREVMNGIDLDPASCAEANETVRAKRYYTKEDNGLAQSWFGKVYCNPPFGRTGSVSNIGLFTRKIVDEYLSGNVEQAILLSTMKTATSWFYLLWDYPICFVDHVVHFNCTRPTKKHPTSTHFHGTIFVYLGKDKQKFANIFSKFGPVIPGNVAVRRRDTVQTSLWEVQS